MSCSSTARIIGLVVGLAAFALAGCGFRPIHGGGGSGGVAHQALADVAVTPVADRVGQLFYNRLLDRMNPDGPAERPRFLLSTTLNESIERVGFQKNEFATRANLRLRANYTLHAAGSGTLLTTNNSTVVASFNILTSDFATLASENEARRRAARELADEVATRISLYFASNPAVAAGTAPP